MVKYIKKHKWIQSILWILFFALIWECSSKLGWTNQYLLPPFDAVITEMCNQISNGTFLPQVTNSFYMIVIGFSISLILAIVIIVLCNYSKIISSMVSTVCTVLTPLPGVAIMPIIIMFFGISEKAVLVLMIHSVLWPLVINILGGFSSVFKEYIEFGQNLELSRGIMAKDVYMFALMPHIIAGTKVGWGRAWRALISSEMAFGMIGKYGGIGYFIYTNRAYGNLTRVMVGVIVVVVLGVLVESALFGVLEKATIRKWGM